MEEILADNAELSEIPWEFLKEPEMESPREVASMSLQPTFPSPRGSATTSRTRGFWSRTRGLGGLEPTVFRIRTMARFVHFSCHVTSGPKLGVNIPCVLNTPRGHPSWTPGVRRQRCGLVESVYCSVNLSVILHSD